MDHRPAPQRRRQLNRTDAPVAVLCSGVTSSSGEATLLAFLGRPRTQTFGMPTGCLTTSADRLGRVYEGGVTPDEHVAITWESVGEVSDPGVRRAAAWLEGELKTLV